MVERQTEASFKVGLHAPLATVVEDIDKRQALARLGIVDATGDVLRHNGKHTSAKQKE